MLTNDEKIKIIEDFQCDFTTDIDESCEACEKELPEHSVIYCVAQSGDGWTEYSYFCEDCMFKEQP